MTTEQTIPRGLCQCGCGQRTTIAKKTDRTTGAGRIAGEPVAFLRGHRRRAPWSPELFWSKVQKTDGCWLWMAARNSKGYGWIKVRGKMVFAHRQAWTLVNGPIPPGHLVLHRCDNPPCVRPDHHFLGTDADNVADKVAKRRQARGVRNGNAKLDPVAVAAIREGLRSGTAASALAVQLGVSTTTISRIGRSLTWREEGAA